MNADGLDGTIHAMTTGSTYLEGDFECKTDSEYLCGLLYWSPYLSQAFEITAISSDASDISHLMS